MFKLATPKVLGAMNKKAELVLLFAGRSRQEMLRAISAAKSRHRSDVDQAKQAENDIAEAAEYLEHATHLALACLLLVLLTQLS